MMNLKVDTVPLSILRILEADGWTVEKLTGAKADDLAHYKGIGAATGWRIIVAARRANKAERAEKPVVVNRRWLTPPVAARGPSLDPPHGLTLGELPAETLEIKFRALAPGEDIPAMSVRVKRNWLIKRLQELGAS